MGEKICRTDKLEAQAHELCLIAAQGTRATRPVGSALFLVAVARCVAHGAPRNGSPPLLLQHHSAAAQRCLHTLPRCFALHTPQSTLIHPHPQIRDPGCLDGKPLDDGPVRVGSRFQLVTTFKGSKSDMM